MSDRNRTSFTEQEIANLTLDNQNVDVTALRGFLVYAPNGWVRHPISNCFPLEKFDYDGSNNVIYKGMNGNYSAADADTTWVIIQFTWVSGNCTVRKMRVTSWTLRTSGW
jgi:hypothetical protein